MADTFSNLDLDLALLHEIADGSDEFIVESIELFLQQLPPSLQDINNALLTKDWGIVAAEAHKLKATLGFFGMLNSQALIQEIEQSCKTGAPDELDIATKFNQVQELIAANTGILTKIKEETKAGL
jgi:HPt (histidine-containing phosphotransfer) domain-containing protein